MLDVLGWRPPLMPTSRGVIYREGSAALYRFHRPDDAPAGPATPVLIVPSLINRWYVVDLRAGYSLVEGLVERGLDVFCLDWGIPGDEDRYLTWDDVLARLDRAVRRTMRTTGAERVALLGYCMGGTLAGIAAALEPARTAALINLLGPFDFGEGGFLAHCVDDRWFNAGAMAGAGNIRAEQMQAGFTSLRPTLQVSKWVSFAERVRDPVARESFAALESWAGDNIPFPAAAYETYIRDLYQANALVHGTHRVAGRRVDLSRIQCPVMSIVAERDEICPPPAATALNELVSASDTTVFSVPGGHVGAVIGSRAASTLYPGIARWLRERVN